LEPQDIALLARAAEELAVLLEEHTGYPDSPERLLQSEPKATSVITGIYCRLIEEGAPIPAPVAHLVTHLHAPNLFKGSAES
jgi:hypothetical protein